MLHKSVHYSRQAITIHIDKTKPDLPEGFRDKIQFPFKVSTVVLHT